MATYYWLGISGSSGNVNTAANWTIWSPQGACGFLPPSAATGPGLNDTVIFTRYNVSGSCYGVPYYPRVSPQGVMLGRTGGGLQHFASVQVFGDCPVPLGASADFKFNATTISLETQDNTNSVPAYSESNIHVGRANASYGYPAISITSAKLHTYNIKGIAQHITVPSTSTTPNNAIINLPDTTVHSSLLVVQGNPNVSNNSVFNIISCGGTYDILEYRARNAVFNMYPGNDVVSPNIIHLERCTFNFVEPGYSGSENNYPRTDINLRTQSQVKDYPTINVAQYVSFENLRLDGGNINFVQLPSENPSVVTSGSMNVQSSRITANSESVSLGSGGEFFVYGDGTVSTSYTPDIQLKGNWAITLLPTIVGASGF